MIGQFILFFIIESSAVRELGDYGIEITFSLEELNRQDFSFPEAGWLNNFGEPNLPSVVYKLGIPQDGDIEVKIVENQQEVMRSVMVAPVIPLVIYEPPVPETVNIYGGVYKKNRLFPEDLIQLSSLGYFRDIYTVDVRLNPVRYNPVLKELVVSKRVKLSIKFTKRPKPGPIIDNSFEEIYKRTITNYNQCKMWRREPKPNNNNPFLTGVWFKIEVGEEGIYRLGYDEIKKAGLDPKQFDPKTMKIYSAAFELLPKDVTEPFPDSLFEIPVYVQGEDDHMFDKEDYLIFYGFPASHFIPDTAIGWFENGYARNNVYWFTFGGGEGRRMAQIPATWNGATPDTLVSEILHIEEDLENPTRSGTNWYWKDISPGEGSSGGNSVNIKHPKANGAIKVTASIFTLENAGPFWYQFSLDDNILFSDTLSLPFHDQWPPYYLVGYGQITADSSTFNISINRVSGTTGKLTAFFNSLEIIYDRITEIKQPFHAFFNTAKNYSLKCSNINSRPFILDITNLKEPKIFDTLTIQGNKLLLSSSSDSFQILYLSQFSLTKPANLIPANPGRLRTQDLGCEYLFITHKNFYNGLAPLVNHRRQEYTTKVVTVDQIFDDFSFGKYDPLAIKHFLYYTTNNWTIYPKYVLLVGDATYDFKNNLGKENPPNFIPMYESGTILSGNAGMPDNDIYEGEYVNFGAGGVMILGRITVRTNQELRDFIDKVITYETKDIDGIWNKRIILAGDDEWADNYQWEGPYMHCGPCESIADLIPDTLYDLAKLYMVSYPNPEDKWQFTYPCKKPNAQADFIRELNKGGLAGVFFGHGNTHQMAHEMLFYQKSDIPLIKNGRKYFFFYFASCTIGRFNDSDWECIAEEFVRIKEGAIGTMAATSGTGRGNVAIGLKLFSLITNPDTNLTMGECFRIAKESGSPIYVLIGDPATKFRKITSRVGLSAVPDSLRPMEKLKVIPAEKPYYLSAYVRDTTHIEKIFPETVNKISGHIYRKVQDGWNSDTTFDYKINGKEIYQGYWDKDTATIIAPKISTSDLPIIKLTSFKNYKSGMLDSIRVFGNAAPSADQTGPEVSLYDGARKLKDGDWVDKKFTLTGRVSDESGMNLLHSKEDDRRFSLQINQDTKTDLRDYFLYDRNSYTSGEFNVEISLPEKKAVDTLVVFVSDNYFNQTIDSLELKVEIYDQISIENFLIYPNPVRDRKGLWFTFNLTGSGIANIKIFTIAGRLIKTIEDIPCRAGYNQIPWDGLDEYQDEISNGVYLVKAVVKAENSNDEVVEKFIIARGKRR